MLIHWYHWVPVLATACFALVLSIVTPSQALRASKHTRLWGVRTRCYADSLHYGFKPSPVGQSSDAFTGCWARWMKAALIQRRGNVFLDDTRNEVEWISGVGVGYLQMPESVADQMPC